MPSQRLRAGFQGTQKGSALADAGGPFNPDLEGRTALGMGHRMGGPIVYRTMQQGRGLIDWQRFRRVMRSGPTEHPGRGEDGTDRRLALVLEDVIEIDFLRLWCINRCNLEKICNEFK